MTGSAMRARNTLGGALLGLGAGTAVVLSWLLTTKHPPIAEVLNLLGVFTATGAIFGILLAQFLGREAAPGLAARNASLTLEARIEHQAQALRNAADNMRAIEREIAAREQLVEKLAADAATHEHLLDVTRQEAEAIARTLRGELARSDTRARREQLLFGLVFFALGVTASVALALLGVGG
jgi:hypothetical protein